MSTLTQRGIISDEFDLLKGYVANRHINLARECYWRIKFGLDLLEQAKEASQTEADQVWLVEKYAMLQHYDCILQSIAAWEQVR